MNEPTWEWRRLPEDMPPPPRHDEVHVWWLDLGALALDDRCCELSPQEHARAERLQDAVVRHRLVASHQAMRRILGAYLDMDGGSIRFDIESAGKPRIAEPSGAALSFNLTRSGDAGLLAVAGGRAVGVDLERRAQAIDWRAIARRYLAPGEREALNDLPASQREQAFFHCWTRKEAYLKGLGIGMRDGLDGFEVRIGPDEPPGVREDRQHPGAAERWSLTDLNVGDDWAAAVAMEGPQIELRMLRRAAL